MVSSPETWLLASALGALVGLIMAMTGAGGGVLAVPLLIFGLGLTVHQAAPVALLAVGAAAGIGALLGLKEGIVRYRAAGLIGGVAMLMAPLGVWLAHRVSQAPLLLGFSAVLAWTAWRMAGLRAPRPAGRPEPPRRVHPCQVNPGEGRLRWTAPCAWVLAGTGLASGLLTGLLGVGGGFVIVPSLTHYTNLEARSIAATSLAVIALATLGGLAAATGHGSLDLPLAVSFGAAATLSLLVGRRLAQRVPPQVLQRSFAAVSAAVAVLMLLRGLGVIAS